MYSATSTAAGTKWALAPGSMSQSTIVPETDTSATTQGNGTPVASWPGGSGVTYHVGLDPNTPATKPDQTVPVTEGGGDVVSSTKVMITNWTRAIFGTAAPPATPAA